MAEIEINKDNFEEEAIKSDIPVLIDFWATWCGPCRMLSPIVAEIAEEYAGKLKVAKVNVDDEPELATAFRVSSIPTVMFIKDGKIVNSFVGYRNKSEVVNIINSVL